MDNYTLSLSVAALNPLISLLAFMNVKWDLPGLGSNCLIQIDVMKWPYYILKPSPAVEIKSARAGNLPSV